MRIKNLLLRCFLLAISLSLTVAVEAQTKKPTVVKRPVVGQKGTLSIEAGLVYKNGDVKPVARAQFFLLDDDAETILQNGGITESREVGMGSGSKMSFVTKLAFWKKYPTLYTSEFLQAIEVLKKHSVAEITTDFSGKAEFPDLKSGKYWLMGIGGANQVVIWNIPTELKMGKQSVTLDNENSTIIL